MALVPDGCGRPVQGVLARVAATKITQDLADFIAELDNNVTVSSDAADEISQKIKALKKPASL
jgi:hypothetical protein